MMTYSSLSNVIKSGAPWVWLTSGTISIIMIAALGLVSLITVKGLAYFWPQPILQYQSSLDGQSKLGAVVVEETVNNHLQQRQSTAFLVQSIDGQTGNLGFEWVNGDDANTTLFPEDAVVMELENGSNVYGFIRKVVMNHQQQQGGLLLSAKKAITAKSEHFHLATTVHLDILDEGIKVYGVNEITRLYQPNTMNILSKLSFFFIHLADFVSQDGFNDNRRGGIFPAIFGTVFLVFLMTLLVAPLGVVAAIYLYEYAQKTWVTRIIRVAVVNLAGVPSIVYGVFGLGFFVYFIGGGIDQALYADSLPNPTFGEPGVLWAALTMAFLTLPVVIVATEEGLSRIPKNTKVGCMALGATRFETLYHVLIPIASPAIITGLILAIARAAGEVAPLMLVGVVKSAPSLPVDGTFPFVHLDRQFMHLGFQIYDAGFQSPNIDSSTPLVYATAMLLIFVILALNITAVSIRNHLTAKYQSMINT